MFAVTPLQFLEYGALKNPHSVREVNEMLREISLPLLRPTREASASLAKAKLHEYARNVHTSYDNTGALLNSQFFRQGFPLTID